MSVIVTDAAAGASLKVATNQTMPAKPLGKVPDGAVILERSSEGVVRLVLGRRRPMIRG